MCIFCQIIEKKLPASMVFEDARCLAFLDIQPINPGHVLVVPRAHVASWQEMEEPLAGHLFQVGQRINKALRASGLRCEGVNYLAADGAAAGQEVFHAHLHVFPRFTGDGFRLKFGEGYAQKPERADLNAVAARLRDAIGILP